MEIVMEGVSKTYMVSGRTVAALSPIHLTIRSGEFVALLGPSGSGKSTLLEIVAGLTEPSSGRTLVGGRRVMGPDRERAVVFQDYALFPWRTVLGNLQYVLEVHKVPRVEWPHRCARFLQMVDMQEFQHAYPHELSGGMKQRVSLARALVGEPQILLMDEPFAAIDAITRRQLQGMLLDIIQQTRKTVLFVTHSIEEALLLADRIAVFSPRPGRLQQIIDIPGQPGARQTRTREMLSLQDNVWRLLETHPTGE